MSSIPIKFDIRKGDFVLSVDTRIPSRGVTGVFGESGCGKTSLLRGIAGLDASTSPDTRPLHERKIGFVFQDPQLFEHLDVGRNIEYGMRRNNASPVAFDEVVQLLELEQLLPRRITELSGGEAQRVAIARVLCQAPELILMDEPLSSLDERRKNDVLPYLEKLHATSAVPIVYVSHDIDEICRLADHLLIMEAGKVVAGGELHDVLARIDLPQLSHRNAGVVIEGQPKQYDDEFDLTRFEFAGGEFWVPGSYQGDPLRLRIAASDVSLIRAKPAETTILNILPAVIDEVRQEATATQLLRLKVGDQYLHSRITSRSLQSLDLKVGDEIFAQIKSVTVRR